MAVGIVRLMLVAGVGWMFYHMLRAFGQRELAAMLQLACYAIAAAIVVEMILGVATWFTNLPVINIFFR